MKNVIAVLVVLISFGLNAQQVQFLDLPSFFDREFEISGLTGNADKLFLAAERCAKIFVIKKEDMTHVETIHLNIDAIKGGIEIEGLTIYKDFLIISDEKNAKILSYNLKAKSLRSLNPRGKDLSSFKGSYGMEGIAVDETSNILYLLREKNEKKQSEIHSFSISEKDGSLNLHFLNQTLIQHESKNWRYTGLSLDTVNKRLLCLKSYYIKGQPRLCKREIHYLQLDSLTTGIAYSNMLISLTSEIYFMRSSFATNVEGIYSDDKSIYVTSDNGEGEKDCDQKSTKTIMIKVKMY
ncbi:SdiA-regulated domain-containing protein [Mangrovimonas aestuarii]|uniref:SdiA-regulated domain-containing protein n=1 Tax=Mangrovimonas aestuarii TaxID=3018443 RepID=UPI0023797B27|nr:SdiA-regulated domain-containing protein [Mangrovimonas aestuarii]